MPTIAYISSAYQEARTYGAGKLTGRERGFLESIHTQSQRREFTGLSPKQAAWFNAIAKKLEATKGKYGFEVIGERHRRRFRHFQDSYSIAVVGY